MQMLHWKVKLTTVYDEMTNSIWLPSVHCCTPLARGHKGQTAVADVFALEMSFATHLAENNSQYGPGGKTCNMKQRSVQKRQSDPH
jgi:hypothetical protein